MSKSWLVFDLFVTAVVWVFLGAILGVASIFLSGSIAAVVLGFVLGVTGAVAHVISQLKPQRPRWWVLSSIIALLSTLITVIVVAQLRELFIIFILLFYYLVFGSMLYVLIERFFVRE